MRISDWSSDVCSSDLIWAGKQSHRQLSDILLRMTGKVLGTEWLILFLTSFDYLQNLLNGFVSELNVFQIGQKKLIDRKPLVQLFAAVIQHQPHNLTFLCLVGIGKIPRSGIDRKSVV